MKNIFKRLSFPVKLGIIGFLPLAVLIYLAIQIQIEKQQKIEVISSFKSSLERNSLIVKLIDNLQAERRFAFAFAIDGSWKNEMITERARVDEMAATLQQSVAEKLKGFETYSLLDQLSKFRQNIDDKQETPQSVMEFYTSVILRLNTLSYISADQVGYLSPVSTDLRSQRILSHMVTYIGILRANLYYGLLTHNLKNTGEVLQRDLLNYKALEKELLVKASSSTLLRYENILEKSNLKSSIDVIQDVVRNQKIVFDNDAENWWTFSLTGVDALKRLQRELLDATVKRTQQISEEENAIKIRNLVIMLLVIALVIFILFYSIKNISQTLNELRVVSQRLALGVTGNHLEIQTKDVISELADAIMSIDKSNVELSHAAREIGQGNFDIAVSARSENDVLGNAVLVMKTDLQKFTEENNRKIWIQTGLNLIGDSVRGEKEVKTLASDALATMVEYLGAQTAVFYTASHTQLHYAAGYAIHNESLLPQKINFGSSLIGAAAKDQKIVRLIDVPDEYVKIVSSTGEFVPRNLLIVPLVHNNRTEGVIELAAFKPFDEVALRLVEQAAPGIAVSLQAALSRAKLQELLEETQAQAEELQTQHSELENLNAELEAQSQKLQASEEELRVQQEELQQTNEELEERSSLLIERNIEVQRKAEELALSTKYKSEFLANMSHELRTPLNSILLLSRLLHENNDKNLNDEEIEYARVIQNSGQGLLALIDEILDLSKIEAGKMEVEFINISIKNVANELNSLFEQVAKEKGIEFKVNIDKKIPSSFESDKVRLGQILKNLISNALKFTSKGSVQLEITPYAKDNNKIAFSVKDTGIGIPADKQQHIFEAFQQADGSTKRKFGGTGLGLSISRELSKLLGGEIKVTSEPGKGSEFTLILPLKHVALLEDEDEEKTELQIAPLPIEHKKPEIKVVKDEYVTDSIPASIADDRGEINSSDKLILIIEDDTAFAKVLLDYTHKKGYKGLVAVRGDEGIQLAQQHKPLGILLDIQLPVKSGWQVMDELKSNPGTRHIPVHMMSSLKMKNESLLRGAVDFIDKPMAIEGMQEMFKKIEFVLNRESKKVLIIEDNPQHAKALAYFLETFQITSELKKNVEDGLASIKGSDIDCVILDMGIPDSKTYAMLESAKKDPAMENIPIIIFTGKSLSKTEEMRIKKYADSIVVKTAHSYQRMLDEVSLFLHVVEENKQTIKKHDGTKKLGELSQVLKNKTVLVVDDDVRNIFSLSKTLENFKMNVLTAVDGHEALAMMAANPGIDVVLLDMMMPNMDGYETAKRIRENRAWKNLPVIAVTAKAMVGDREKCIEAGASDYITKPVDIDQLVSLLRVWLYDRV